MAESEHKDRDRILIAIEPELQQALAQYIQQSGKAKVSESDRASWKLTIYTIGAIALAVYMWFVISTAMGKQAFPSHNHAAIISLVGTITESSESQSADTINRLISTAMANSSTKAVVLHINSSGGSPTIAQRIGQHARQEADRHQKPLFVHIDGAGASAAYLLALYADEIYASQYSLTGSIGAVVNTFNWSELAQRVGVYQSAIASSDFKAALSPWTETRDEDIEEIRLLVDEIADDFVAQVMASRGDRLQMTHAELKEARIYRAPQALNLGLIDGVGTLEEVLRDEINLRGHRVQPRRNLYEQLITMAFEPVLRSNTLEVSM
jgi:protease IV